MAAIGTIRKQSGLLIILIGASMVLFLLGDLFSGGSNLFTSNDQEVGEIAGESINLQDFELRVQNAIDEQYGMEGATESVKKNIRDRIWQEMVRERVLETELTKLGISVSPEEILDQVKNTRPGSILYQYFTDPRTGQVIEDFRDPQTGGLNSQRVMQAIQNLLNSENASDWLPIENAIKQDIAMNKYMDMLSKGMMISSVEARQIENEKGAQISFTYAVKEFSSLDDEEFEPSEAELNTYFNEHKHEERFQVKEETRSAQLALFNVSPTPEDIEAVRADLESIKANFANDTNDTAFVAENAEGQMNELIRYFSKDEVHPSIKDSLSEDAMGKVFGPVPMGERMMLYKLSEIDYTPDSVKASHILISINDGDTAKISAAKAKLDSLKTVALKNKNFAALATEFSEDFGSAEKGGDLDWFARGMMVAPFEKAAFAGKVGDMVIVESQFGVHLIYITDQSELKARYLLSAVDRLIEPSKATSDAAYKLASTFAIEHSTLESFKDPQGAMVEMAEHITMGQQSIGQLREAREVVKWIFESEVGAISSPFETEDFFAVVAIASVSPAGTMSLENATPLIRQEVINKKKAEKIIADLGNVASIDEAANKFGTDVKVVSNVNFAQGSLPGGLGREPRVLGAASALPETQVSSPIIGERGVFVIQVNSRIEAPADVDLAETKRRESSGIASRVNSKVYEALKKHAGVKDQRAKYY